MKRKRKWLTGTVTTIGIAAVLLTVPGMAANAATPAEIAPAHVECTVTFAGIAEQGLTGAESITTSFDLAPTVASCLDRRTNQPNKIMGGTVTAAAPGTLTGNCAAPKAEIMAQVTWIYGTPLDKPDVSTLKLTAGVTDGVPDLRAEVTGGPLQGWSIDAVPVSPDELAASAELFMAACMTPDGAKYAVGAVRVFFREPIPTPTAPIEPIEPVVPPAEPADPAMPNEPVEPVASIADPAVEPVAPIAAPGEPVAVPAAPLSPESDRTSPS
jgi:hypothetical protein